MVRNPVIAQAPIKSAGELVSRAISAETMKMPEPIIEPITSMVTPLRPRPLTNSRSEEESAFTGIAVASVLNKAPCGRPPWVLRQRPTNDDDLQLPQRL